jgi:transmembrane sensor
VTPSSKSRDPAVEKLMADTEASNGSTSDGSSSAQHDPALLKALAEASAWIVTLHGPERTPAVERGFQRWLAENPRHRYAFEHATETWSKTRAAVRRSAQVEISVPGNIGVRPHKKRPRAVLALAASLLVAAVGIGLYVQQSGLQTGIGERRTVVLDDGTQVTLNTATEITVHYDEHQRHVTLESGEAFFDVARRPEWPFVVTAGDREVTALGTSFLVRRDSARVAVTLLEGKVRVTSSVVAEGTLRSLPVQIDAGGQGGMVMRPERKSTEVASGSVVGDREAPAATHPLGENAGEAVSVTLVPGQRIVFSEDTPPLLDRPELQKLTAWQQGLVNIDDLTLAQAVEEMNRYSTLQLVVEGAAADIHVSGVFRVTDSENLAQAVALTHGLDLRKEGRRIVLSGTPRPPSEARFAPTSPEADRAP